MTDTIAKHVIPLTESVRAALTKLNDLGVDGILFIVDENDRLLGSLTDGDLRRGFIQNLGFDDPIDQFMHRSPVVVRKEYTLQQLSEYQQKNIRIVPIIGEDNRILDILNFRLQTTLVPADAVIMAGGQGKRLMPLTANTPKPLLEVGGKPIIEHNIDRLIYHGIRNIHISINYLGEQLENYFGDGSQKNARIHYLRETKPLGTIGSILLADQFEQEDILVMNSDLLTTIDFGDFYATFKEQNADMAIAATTYNVDIPYAVLEVDSSNLVQSLREKPRYSYFSNAGIYLLKKELLGMIPKDEHYDITDLIESVMQVNRKVVTYPITGYWLDIGKPADYAKAQEDIRHLKL